MTSAAPVRPRPRAFWADARFFLGLLLIVASVIGVWFVVAAARQTTPVLAAARTLVPGEAIDSGDLRVVEVSLGQGSAAYLTSADLTGEVVASRTIEEGELVPVAAVTAAGDVSSTTVVVSSASEVPSSVDAGSVVEVWAATPDDEGGPGTPRILVPDAVVARVSRDDAVIGSGRVSLELVISRSDVADTLAAMAEDATMSVVPLAAGSR